MQLVDTHCHIHEATDSPLAEPHLRDMWAKSDIPTPDGLIADAAAQGVTRLICVGTSANDSKLAVDFVTNRENCWASIGIHPHEAKDGEAAFAVLRDLVGVGKKTDGAVIFDVSNKDSRTFSPPKIPAPSADASSGRSTVSEQASAAQASQEWVRRSAARADGPAFSLAESQARRETHTLGLPERERAKSPNKIVAIGECGLDYFYTHSPKQAQIKALHFQIQLALKHNLPLIFHVREAFDDFWPIFDQYQNIRGVLHSYTDNLANLDKALARGLHIGANGIMTFTKDQSQLQMIKSVPLQKLLIETDAPFLTPRPFRGKVNKPANARLVAEFLAELREETPETLAIATTYNAQTLFNL